MSDNLHPSPVHETPERDAYDLPQLAARLGISRSSVYRWAANGTIPTIRLGRRLLVPRAAVVRLLDPRSTQMNDSTHGE
jgi:excisionase family DNA binding protein